MKRLLINILLLLLQKFLIRIVQMIKRNWIQACSANMQIFPKESLSKYSLKVQATSIILSYYRSPKKLQEGNVFSHVCLFVIPSTGWSQVTITHDALDLTVHGPTPASDIWYLGLNTYSNLFTWAFPWCWHLVVAITESFAVSISRRYAADWNAFLSCCVFHPYKE